MKAHYFRSFEYEYYLVPEEHKKGFDKLVDKISNASGSKQEDLYDEFNNVYHQYKCEGELYDTKLFISQEK